MDSFERHMEKTLNKICIKNCPIVNLCPEMHECKHRKFLRECIIGGMIALEDIRSCDSNE